MSYINKLSAFYTQWLTELGFSSYLVTIIQKLSLLLIVLFVFLVIDRGLHKYGRKRIKKLIDKSPYSWDKILYRHKVFSYFLRLIPAVLLLYSYDLIFDTGDGLASFLVICTKLYIVYLIVAGLVTALQAANDIYLSDNKKQPHDSIKPNIQIVQLLVLAVGVLVSLSILISQDIKVLVGGLGAFAAVLILIFKDSIQGFVGGFLLKMNHLLQMGDWIAVPKYQVDGIVTDISLTTIQVQNWDNSISSIPTYSLVNDSFHNWQGMLQSGGRRIKRHINIDMTSIKFCSESMLEKYSKIKLLEQYIADKETELASYNRLFSNNFEAVNERQQTNLGIFRAYITRYLQAHQDIHDTMTVMVRQLPLTENGLPIEVYAFSKILSLVEYETLQADIFDHLLAIIPEFELRIFQSPTGADLRYEKHQNIA